MKQSNFSIVTKIFSFKITVRMADLTSIISRVWSPTCTICCEYHQEKQMVVQTPGLGIYKGGKKWPKICL